MVLPSRRADPSFSSHAIIFQSVFIPFFRPQFTDDVESNVLKFFLITCHYSPWNSFQTSQFHVVVKLYKGTLEGKLVNFFIRIFTTENLSQAPSQSLSHTHTRKDKQTKASFNICNMFLALVSGRKVFMKNTGILVG